jgi:hypothetical protein
MTGIERMRIRFEVAMMGRVVEADGDCHIWKGHVDDKGYPRAKLHVGSGKQRGSPVQREWWRLYRGSPSGMWIGTTCGNKLCVNPKHIAPVNPPGNYRLKSPRARQVQPTPPDFL